MLPSGSEEFESFILATSKLIPSEITKKLRTSYENLALTDQASQNDKEIGSLTYHAEITIPIAISVQYIFCKFINQFNNSQTTTHNELEFEATKGLRFSVNETQMKKN